MKLTNYEIALLDKDPKLINVNYDYSMYILNNMSEKIKQQSSYKEIRKGEILIKKDDAPKYVFVVLKGSLKVVNEFESGKLYESGGKQTMDFIGVIEVLVDVKEIAASVIALTDTYYFQIPKNAFLEWINEEVIISNYILKYIGNIVYPMMKYRGDNMLRDSIYFLLDYLLLNNVLTKYKGVTIYENADTKKLISERTGLSERTLFRNLNKLRSEGYINTKYKSIYFDDMQKSRLLDLFTQVKNN